MLWRLQGETGIACRGFTGVALRGQEWVVERADQQGRHGDTVEHRPAAALRPIIVGPREAMDRRGIGIVELGKGAHAVQAFGVERAGESPCFFADLGAKAPHEARHVDAVLPPFQLLGAAGQITGHAERDRAPDARIKLRAEIAQIFERHVSAQTEADEAHFPVMPGGKNMIQHNL